MYRREEREGVSDGGGIDYGVGDDGGVGDGGGIGYGVGDDGGVGDGGM